MTLLLLLTRVCSFECKNHISMVCRDMAKRILLMVTLSSLFVTLPATEDWTNCAPCKCSWVNGRKKADCNRDRGVTFNNIPNNLSSEIRSFDLTKQPLYEIKKRAFISVNLGDLQKIKLVQCSIMTVHKHAFENMSLLIELDLSNNEIERLDVDTFRDNTRLRVLFLNNNKLKKLEDGLFPNPEFLQRVEIKNNRILHVGKHVFVNANKLQYIMLDGNQLTYMDTAVIDSLDILSSLGLHNNPWRCDCHLKVFRDLTISKNLFTSSVECRKPDRLNGRRWVDLSSEDFACVPRIMVPQNSGMTINAESENVTMPCKVSGDPKPDVNWVFRHSIVDTNPRRPGSQRYAITTNMVGDDIYWVNLTVIRVSFHDGGVYRCTAKNPGGMDERNVTLTLSDNYGANSGVLRPITSLTDPLALILSVVLVIVVLALIVTLILWYCVCRRRNIRHHKGDSLSPNGDICMEDTASEMGKSLITEVNPVVKPPRQYSVPPSVASGVTEVSEVNRTLLDNDSVFAGGDDDSRSFDFLEPTPRKSQNFLDMDQSRPERPYPPDLLSFPVRGIQVSPAGSLASTVPDHSRLPPQHGPQSPIHSPLYDSPGIYRTLPYSRSHSPFTPPAIIPRSGYITIPRRPRVPSWSSAPPSTPLVAEPVYDNLGLRTTAEGSSILSLNKIGEVTPRPRPVATPNSLCAPIKEQDGSRTLPTQRSLQNLNLSPDGKRESWTRAAPEGCSQKPSIEADVRRFSNASMTSVPDGSAKKMPPKPPPKPKKMVATGPLFEDEGEDGTEV